MDKRIIMAIKKLSPELLELHKEAIVQGYKDKICLKCGVVYLAHHHFINCALAHTGECPMIAKGTKSLINTLLEPEEGTLLEPGEGMMIQHVLKIVPAIAPIARHRIEDTLAKIGCKPYGGGTRTNWSFSDISFDHKEGLKEVQSIIKHKHMREIDQIGGDGIRVVTIRPALLEGDRRIVEAAFKAMGYKIFGGNTARDLSSSEFAFAWR